MEAALPVVSEQLTANALAPDSENCFKTRASGARRCDTEPSEACPELTPGDCSFSFAYAADNPTLYSCTVPMCTRDISLLYSCSTGALYYCGLLLGAPASTLLG